MDNIDIILTEYKANLLQIGTYLKKSLNWKSFWLKNIDDASSVYYKSKAKQLKQIQNLNYYIGI